MAFSYTLPLSCRHIFITGNRTQMILIKRISIDKWICKDIYTGLINQQEMDCNINIKDICAYLFNPCYLYSDFLYKKNRRTLILSGLTQGGH